MSDPLRFEPIATISPTKTDITGLAIRFGRLPHFFADIAIMSDPLRFKPVTAITPSKIAISNLTI